MADDAYNTILNVDPFAMFDDVGLVNEVITSLLAISGRIASQLASGDDLSDDDEAECGHLANLIRAASTIHETNADTFNTANEMLHHARIPAQFRAKAAPGVVPAQDRFSRGRRKKPHEDAPA